MLKRIVAAVRSRHRPPQHPQLARVRAQCSRDVTRLIRDFEQLRREVNAQTNVLNLMKIQRAVAALHRVFFEQGRK
jgi:hypothetical protein